MFLATTSLSDFWDNRDEMLFLGSWCLRHDQREVWSRLRYRVLPSPWNDRERFYQAAETLDQCGERMLTLLSDRLNTLHGIQAPLRYWRILIGPWLVHHLHVLYDRHVHLQAAFAQEGSLKTLCLDPASFRVPQDTATQQDWVQEDPYNLQLYSGLLTHMGHSFPLRRFSEPGSPKTRSRIPLAPGPRVSRRLQGVFTGLLKHRWEIALYETALPRSALCRIAWCTGFRALPLALAEDQWPSGFTRAVFDGRRASLADLPHQDEFERLFIKMLPQDFPSLYLEGYRAARENTLKALPENPSAILSGIGWHFHERFKWIAAEATLKKCRLVALQHGGGYGVYRFTPMERHEKRISDSFLVWGWGDGNGGHVKNVPAPQLSSVPRRDNGGLSRDGDPILFIATTNPPYFYRFCSQPQGNQLEDYFQWQFRFLQSVPSPLRERIFFRPHIHPDAHGLKERLTERFPDLRWQEGVTFHQGLRRSSLVVIDHLGTPLLETLAANRPTVLFWDPQRWEVRPEAEPSFDALRKAGILWDSPETAAAHLREIADAPSIWWADPKIQEVRRSFVARYAFCRQDWDTIWLQTLREEVSL